MSGARCGVLFFFFHDTATTEIYTLSLHDALPICAMNGLLLLVLPSSRKRTRSEFAAASFMYSTILSQRASLLSAPRSEEHTSELQSQFHLVCRLLLEKKKKSTPTPALRPPPHLSR